MILVIIIVATLVMITMGFEPGAALGSIAVCGLLAAEVATRLLGPLPATTPSLT